MTETLYAIRLESGGGSLNGEILGTADTLKDAREGAVSFRENMLPYAELTVWRMERVGEMTTMSDMNDPIDPAIVEKACEAYRHPKRMLTNDSGTRHHDCMTAALEAAAPLIAAKALREAAEVVLGPSSYLADAATCRGISNDLRARADALEAGQP